MAVDGTAGRCRGRTADRCRNCTAQDRSRDGAIGGHDDEDVPNKDVVVQVKILGVQVDVIVLNQVTVRGVRLAHTLRWSQRYDRLTFAGCTNVSCSRWTLFDVASNLWRSTDVTGWAAPSVVGRDRSRRRIGRISRPSRT